MQTQKPQPWQVAIHEAGHACVGRRLGLPVDSVTIERGAVPGAYGGAYTNFRKGLADCSLPYALRRASLAGSMELAGPVALGFALARHNQRPVSFKLEGSDARMYLGYAAWCAEHSAASLKDPGISMLERAERLLNDPDVHYGIGVLSAWLVEHGTAARAQIDGACEIGRALARDHAAPAPCEVRYVGDGRWQACPLEVTA